MTHRRSTFFTLIFLFFFSLAVQLAGTWILPLVDRDETFYAEATREMIQRSDYVVPYYNNKFWLEKPPLLYWCQCICFKVFGENSFAARFPSVVATALTALVIFGFGSRLYDRKIAWRAAVAFVLCLQLLIYGRAGIPDMLVVLFTTLAAWAGWELCRQTAEKKWWWIFYLSLAAIAYAKGPLAIIPVLSVLLFAFWSRPARFLQSFKFARGLLLTDILIALWAVPIMQATHGEFYRVFIGEHVLSRSVSPMQGHGGSNLWSYLATLPLYVVLLIPAFLPWTFYLIPAVRRMRRERTAADIYLASGILVTFFLFSIARTKLPHYTLPAFPLLACAVAPSLSSRFFRPLAAGMVAVNLILAFVLFPVAARSFAPQQLAASPLLQSEMEFGTVEYTEPSLTWEFRRKVKAFPESLSPKRVEKFMKQSGPRFCVLPTSVLADLAKGPEWHAISANGMNLAKGKPLELSMLVKSGDATADKAQVGRAKVTQAPDRQ